MLPAVVLMSCLAAVVSASSPDQQLDQHWNMWKSKYHKAYDEREEGWRRLVWEENLKKIELHNLEHSMGKHTFTLGMNHFGDMTNEEFRQTMNGYKPKPNQKTKGSLFMKPNFLMAPSSVDWRTQGYVTPVKDQGQCGSCWAFSATGSMEGQLFRKSGILKSLSEQNLVDCSRPEGNEGCNGGLMDQAFQYVIDNGSLDCENFYPYVGTDQPCRYNASYSCITLTGYVDLPQGNEGSLMEAVAAVGPVSVGIDAGHISFQLYESGIYYEPDCSSEYLDHGVLVVGYGYTTSGNYWIVKNSWGSTWGDNGYIYMSKDRFNNCGIATVASYPVI